jgi:hypothetical protein
VCRAGGGDCLIKLFGTTIPVPETAAAVGDADKVCKPLPLALRIVCDLKLVSSLVVYLDASLRAGFGNHFSLS